jgi:hypothetical protein
MVFGGEYHVPLAGSPSQINERARIEFRRVEPFWQLAIFGFRYLSGFGPHDGPRRFDAGERVRSPVDEHAELCVAVPGGAVIVQTREAKLGGGGGGKRPPKRVS